MAPKQFYSDQLKKFAVEINLLRKKRNIITWLRFIILMTMIIFAFLIYSKSLTTTIIIIFFLLIGLVYYTNKDTSYEKKMQAVGELMKINKAEIDILAGNYKNLPTGIELVPNGHQYALDLDIFGKASLYQYINRSTSEQGHQILAKWFLNPSTADVILRRQRAIDELAIDTEWRQKFQVIGKTATIRLQTEKNVTSVMLSID